MTYATDQLYAEIAYVAYHFHWPLGELLDLEHHERLRYAAEIDSINARTSRGRG